MGRCSKKQIFKFNENLPPLIQSNVQIVESGVYRLPPATIYQIYTNGAGGGGAGATIDSDGHTISAGGGGGGSGYRLLSTVAGSTKFTPVTIEIGKAGSGGLAGFGQGSNGQDGGATKVLLNFSTMIIANGGQGGQAGPSEFQGGAGGNGFYGGGGGGAVSTGGMGGESLGSIMTNTNGNSLLSPLLMAGGDGTMNPLSGGKGLINTFGLVQIGGGGGGGGHYGGNGGTYNLKATIGGLGSGGGGGGGITGADGANGGSGFVYFSFIPETYQVTTHHVRSCRKRCCHNCD